MFYVLQIRDHDVEKDRYVTCAIIWNPSLLCNVYFFNAFFKDSCIDWTMVSIANGRPFSMSAGFCIGVKSGGNEN